MKRILIIVLASGLLIIIEITYLNYRLQQKIEAIAAEQGKLRLQVENVEKQTWQTYYRFIDLSESLRDTTKTDIPFLLTVSSFYDSTNTSYVMVEKPAVLK